jgi:hypothetical protein
VTVDSVLADPPLCCVPPPSLTAAQIIRAAAEATRLHPPNAPPQGVLAAVRDFMGAASVIPEPLHIALLTNAYWGSRQRVLSVSFMEETPADLAARIVSHANAWNCGITFALTNGVGDVRISRGPGGYYSYLGVGITQIPQDTCTMNLEQFTMDTPESEFHRVVRHEFGHTLGFPHEHMRKEIVARINPQAAYRYFRQTQGWSRQDVDQQVLTPLDDRALVEAPADQTSIMAYQMPASITNDGQPIVGGLDINPEDAAFALAQYPLAVAPTLPPVSPPTVPTPTPAPTTPDVSGGIVVSIPEPGEYLVRTTFTKR